MWRLAEELSPTDTWWTPLVLQPLAGVETRLKLIELTACLCLTAFDGTLLCTDCMENRSSYSKDPDYMTQGLEYQQHPAPPAPQRHSGEQPNAASLWNGSATRSRQDGREVHQNNNREGQHHTTGGFSRRDD